MTKKLDVWLSLPFCLWLWGVQALDTGGSIGLKGYGFDARIEAPGKAVELDRER